MTDLELFRSLQNSNHYVVIEANSQNANAVAVRESRNLAPFARIADDGAPVLGLDRTHALASIAQQGFYAFAVFIEPRDNIE